MHYHLTKSVPRSLKKFVSHFVGEFTQQFSLELFCRCIFLLVLVASDAWWLASNDALLARSAADRAQSELSQNSDLFKRGPDPHPRTCGSSRRTIRCRCPGRLASSTPARTCGRAQKR